MPTLCCPSLGIPWQPRLSAGANVIHGATRSSFEWQAKRVRSQHAWGMCRQPNTQNVLTEKHHYYCHHYYCHHYYRWILVYTTLILNLAPLNLYDLPSIVELSKFAILPVSSHLGYRCIFHEFRIRTKKVQNILVGRSDMWAV